jgi:hypothetical protein
MADGEMFAKYEYKIVDVSSLYYSMEILEKDMNEWVREGWRPIMVIGKYQVVFERPVIHHHPDSLPLYWEDK